MTRATINPQLLRWACDRAGESVTNLAQKFKSLPDWLVGERAPTLNQLKAYARATRTPFGFFFLPEPPVEKIPIQDYRTLGSDVVRDPSPELLDTIYLCQQRQDWYRQEANFISEAPLEFIGSATIQSDVISTASHIREAVGFDLGERTKASTVDAALRTMLEAVDHVGILVMISGIVGHNTQRTLDTIEFRGFALSDALAPLIFINGTDTKSGQMFTLAHELAHLWLGQSGVSDATPASTPSGHAGVERWCNAVAAEVLVPMANFRTVYRRGEDSRTEMHRLRRHFKVSTLVILRRMLDANGLTRKQFQLLFDDELSRLKAEVARRKKGSSGGDYYASTSVRVCPRFARAVLSSTWEGRSTFTEAFRLLGCRKVKTLENLGKHLGMIEYLHGGAV